MSKIKVTSRKAELLAAEKSQIKKALTECVLIAEGYAKTKCPVDTGRLRGSISHKVVENEGYIGTNVEYAPYVEFGTGSHYAGGSGITGMRAQPYLKPAISEHMDEYRRIIKDNLKG